VEGRERGEREIGWTRAWCKMHASVVQLKTIVGEKDLALALQLLT
jgi:hypothetical protein